MQDKQICKEQGLRWRSLRERLVICWQMQSTALTAAHCQIRRRTGHTLKSIGVAARLQAENLVSSAAVKLVTQVRSRNDGDSEI